MIKIEVTFQSAALKLISEYPQLRYEIWKIAQ
jgi:hypothetical protein